MKTRCKHFKAKVINRVDQDRSSLSEELTIMFPFSLPLPKKFLSHALVLVYSVYAFTTTCITQDGWTVRQAVPKQDSFVEHY